MSEVHSGFVPIVGRPNVGKSTLVNALVGEKVSIISSRPQTTRNTIRGVVTGIDAKGDPEYQLVLIDTPGVHKPKTELGNRLNSLVYGTLSEADVVVFVLDATQPVGPGDRRIADRLRQADATTVVVVNKVDVADRGSVVAQLSEAAEWGFDAYVPVSALQSENLDPVVDELVARIPEGPLYFDPETRSDQPDHDLAAEIVREKFLDRLRDEVPHSLIVVVDDMAERSDDLQVIAARGDRRAGFAARHRHRQGRINAEGRGHRGPPGTREVVWHEDPPGPQGRGGTRLATEAPVAGPPRVWCLTNGPQDLHRSRPADLCLRRSGRSGVRQREPEDTPTVLEPIDESPVHELGQLSGDRETDPHRPGLAG